MGMHGWVSGEVGGWMWKVGGAGVGVRGIEWEWQKMWRCGGGKELCDWFSTSNIVF